MILLFLFEKHFVQLPISLLCLSVHVKKVRQYFGDILWEKACDLAVDIEEYANAISGLYVE